MAMPKQRYISKELTHFVGKGLRPNSQYKLLIKILISGWLTHPPHDPHVSGNLVVNTSAKISQNDMYSPQVVCFCDIPIEDLTLHTVKYSPFGLAFDKDFIVKNGGTPVHYIPITSSVRVLRDLSPEQLAEFTQQGSAEHMCQHIDKGEYFDKVVRHYHKLFQLIHMLIFEELKGERLASPSVPRNSIWDLPRDSDGYPIFDFPRNAPKHIPRDTSRETVRDAIWYDQRLSELQRFLDFHIFSYLKFFNHSYPDNHPDNYYFEREWRVVGNIQFNINDVKRVFIPEKYAKQFRQDCPQFYGQLTFLE